MEGSLKLFTAVEVDMIPIVVREESEQTEKLRPQSLSGKLNVISYHKADG